MVAHYSFLRFPPQGSYSGSSASHQGNGLLQITISENRKGGTKAWGRPGKKNNLASQLTDGRPKCKSYLHSLVRPSHSAHSVTMQLPPPLLVAVGPCPRAILTMLMHALATPECQAFPEAVATLQTTRSEANPTS